MSNITLRARVLILSLILATFAPFSAGTTLAAKNGGSATADATAGSSQSIGQLIVTGSVTVNDKKAITGTTIFTDSRIVVTCAKGSSAIVSLGRLGRIELTPGARLTLRFGGKLIGGDLAEGKALISAPAGVKVAINTPDGITSGGGDAAVTPVVAPLSSRCAPAVAGSPGSMGMATPAPAGAAPPVQGGVNRRDAAVIAGVVGGVVAATVIALGDDDDDPIPPVVSPTRP